MRPGRFRVREPEVQAVQVSPENAREAAAWCDGWATDDLSWSEHMICYLRPQDGTPMAGSLFPSDGRYPAPGAVMLGYGVLVPVGDWIVRSQGRFRWVAAAEFESRYDEILSAAERRARGLTCSYPENAGGGHVDYCNAPMPCPEHG